MEATYQPMGFARRMREVVGAETQREIAQRLGFTGSRISQIMRGERPSREFVERFVEEYRLPREEWLALAGYGPRSDPEEARLESLADRVADKVAARVRYLLEPEAVPSPAADDRAITPEEWAWIEAKRRQERGIDE